MEELEEQIKQIVSYSQNIDSPIIKDVLQEWYRAKSPFIKKMGGLIYEHPFKVSFPLGEEEKRNSIDNFISAISFNWGLSELATYIDIERRGFFQNLTTEDYLTNQGVTIKRGTKLVKTFKYFIDSSRLLENIQNEASRIIQENKVEGKLCLSVHPLDYLSSSETAYNWRSCHSLDGEYRAGNFSYMMDPSTIVCYLKSEEQTKLPNFPDSVLWNNKKWRVLLFFAENNDIIFAGRQYPLEAANSLNFILKNCLPEANLIESSPDFYYSDWTQVISDAKIGNEKFPLHEFYLPVEDSLIELSKVIKNSPAENPAHYNDLLFSSCYKPFYAQKIYNDSFKKHYLNSFKPITIGHSVPCLKCGKGSVGGGNDTMMCDPCELKFGSLDNDYFTYCDCCGSRMFVDDGFLTDDESTVCQDCYDRYYRQCESCGKIFHEDSIRYDDEYNEYICVDCYNERFED